MSNLFLRLMTATIAIPTLLVINFIGGIVFAVAIGGAALISAFELIAMLRASGYNPPAILVATGTVVMAVTPLIAASAPGAWTVTLFVILAASGVYFLLPAVYGESLASWALTLFPLVYIGLGLGYLSLLRAGHDGAWWVVFVLVITWSYDTGAYAAGRVMGKRAFMSHVSPKKTVEGVLGGLTLASIAAVLVPGGPGLGVARALSLGFVGGTMAQLGDLIESMLKRQARFKDSGSSIPGHGGLLDRIDSLLFVSVAVYCGAKVFGYAS